MNLDLPKEDIERYSRQLLLKEFGMTGQKALKSARVLVVGAGGLGCPTAMYLAGAGVGTIGIADFDKLSIDNLHRQIAHPEKAIGQEKVESLKSSILGLNSNISVKIYSSVIKGATAMNICSEFDVVADCSDNAATRYMLNDVCVLLRKPLVSGSALRWEGQLTVYNYGEVCPCYRCLFPQPPSPHLVTNCSEGGVIGPVVGVIGSMQALEVIKIIIQSGETLAGRLFIFDAHTFKTRTIMLRKRQTDCQVCGDAPTINGPIDYELFCGSGLIDKNPSLSLLEPHERVNSSEYSTLRNSGTLIDTRPSHEFEIAALPEAKNVPLNSLKQLTDEELRKILEIPDKKDVFIICHRGNDSQLAVRLIQERFADQADLFRVRDIIGGYEQWADEIDSSFPRY